MHRPTNRLSWDWDTAADALLAAVIATLTGCALWILCSGLASGMPNRTFAAAAAFSFLAIAFLFALALGTPQLATMGAILLFPFTSRLADYCQFQVEGIKFTLESVLVIGLFMVGAFQIVRRGYLRKDQLLCWIAAFAGYLIFQSLAHGDIDSRTYSILVLGALIPWLHYLNLTNFCWTVTAAKRLVRALMIALLISSCYALTQPFLEGTAYRYLTTRNSSFYYNPMVFAGIICLLFPILVTNVRLLCRKRVVQAAIVGIALLSLILTGSKSLLIVWIGQSAYLLAFKFRPLSRWLRTRNTARPTFAHKLMRLAGVLTVAAALGHIAHHTIARFMGSDISAAGNSTHERLLGSLAALEMGLSHPFGIGLGNFIHQYRSTWEGSMGAYNLEHAHNFLMDLFAETGIAGMFLFLALICAFFVKAERVRLEWKPGRYGHQLMIAVQASLLGFFAFSILGGFELLHKYIVAPMLFFTSVLAIPVIFPKNSS